MTPPIALAWRQLLAAYWSIAWPPGIAYILGFGVFVNYLPTNTLSRYGILVNLSCNLVFFLVQALLIQRLIRKRYRGFHIRVERPNDVPPAGLSFRDCVYVAVRVLWPQTAFYVAVLFISAVVAYLVDPVLASAIGSLFVPVRILLVGPYAIRLAIPGEYPGFRLQPDRSAAIDGY